MIQSETKKPRSIFSAFQGRYKLWSILGVILISIAFYFLLDRSTQVGATLSTITVALAPILMGVVVAYLLNPLETRLRATFTRWFCRKKTTARRRSLAKGLSIGVSVLLFATALVLFVLAVVPEIVRSIARVVDAAPAQIQNILTWVNDHSSGESESAMFVRRVLQEALKYTQNWMTTALPSLAESALKYLTDGVVSVVKSVFNVVVALVVAIYVLKDKHLFLGQSKKIVCALFPAHTANRVLDTARHANKIVGGYLVGIIIESLLVGVITFVFLSMMQMPYTLLVSVIICVTNVIPFFGPIIGAIPSAALILLSDFRQGIIFIVFIIILQQIEGNIIAPRVLGDTTGVSAFWVTFALLLFGSLFGFVGMLIGVPLFAVLYYLVSIWINEKLKARQLPTCTDAYAKASGIADGVLFCTPLPPKEESNTEK